MVLLPVRGAVPQTEESKPLTTQQLYDLLTVEKKPAWQIVEIIKERGLDFEITPEIELNLKTLRVMLTAPTPGTVEPEPRNGEQPNRLLTAAEVMQRTGLRRGAVYRLGKQGQLGAVRLGERGVRFSERGLDAWLRDGGARRS